MDLYFSPTSPYVRKVRVTAIEKGLGGSLNVIPTDTFGDVSALHAANPLGKVPALVTDAGAKIFDSPVICAYLDSLTPAPKLIPEDAGRWAAMTREALCDGILDAAFASVMERRRPEAERSQMWLERWDGGILRALDAAEADIEGYQGPISLAQIALGAALGYLDFRRSELSWRSGRPQLEAWWTAFSERPSMKDTAPPAG